MKNMFYNIRNNFFIKKILCNFAAELPLRRSIQMLLIAVFFISAQENSIGCCAPSDRRYVARLTVSKQGVQQSFFYFKTFKTRQMRRSVEKCQAGKKSTRKASSNSTKTISTLTPRQGNLLKRVKFECIKSDIFYAAVSDILKNNDL